MLYVVMIDSAFPRLVTSFLFVVRFSEVFHVNFFLLITFADTDNSIPLFTIDPTLLVILLPGIPSEGDVGVLRIRFEPLMLKKEKSTSTLFQRVALKPISNFLLVSHFRFASATWAL